MEKPRGFGPELPSSLRDIALAVQPESVTIAAGDADAFSGINHKLSMVSRMALARCNVFVNRGLAVMDE